MYILTLDRYIGYNTERHAAISNPAESRLIYLYINSASLCAQSITCTHNVYIYIVYNMLLAHSPSSEVTLRGARPVAEGEDQAA
jgi:hypothetical protein